MACKAIETSICYLVPSAHQIVARYVTTPPAVFAHKLKQFLRDNPPPSGHRVTLQWKEVVSPPILRQRQRRARVGTNKQTHKHKQTIIDMLYNVHIGAIRPPKGYVSMDFPLLVGNTDDGPQEEQCPYCLCVPCIIVQPPSFLTGSAASSLGNISKRFALYRKFWQLLKELRLWQCDVYLQRKSVRTSTDDPREIIPECIVKVRIICHHIYMYTYN